MAPAAELEIKPLLDKNSTKENTDKKDKDDAKEKEKEESEMVNLTILSNLKKCFFF